MAHNCMEQQQQIMILSNRKKINIAFYDLIYQVHA